jgi:poly(3-hydroxyalkanoate) synthetase
MANLNPNILRILAQSGFNPQTAAMSIINQNYQNNPAVQQLVAMGNQNNIEGLKQLAQQILGQQGLDLNTELNNLMNQRFKI